MAHLISHHISTPTPSPEAHQRRVSKQQQLDQQNHYKHKQQWP
jgi:hypothetical protein